MTESSSQIKKRDQMPPPPSPNRRQWWTSNRKVAERNVKEARILLSSQDAAQREAALHLLDAAIELRPRWETPLHLKATTLLSLRRHRDVVDLLRHDLPEDSPISSSSISCGSVSRDTVNLLNATGPSGKVNAATKVLTRCCFLPNLAGKHANGRRAIDRHHWRYIVLGQALFHLGFLEDSLLLLQAGRRLASASSRHQSVLFSDDAFAPKDAATKDENESVSQLVSNLKTLLRRRMTALAAMDAGMPEEAIRHFSKILDGSRRAVPQAFLTECYLQRAAAYRGVGRLAESIADCNRTLALDPACIAALSARAALLEQAQCFPECLQDLEHLKLLYDSIICNGHLAGSAWHQPGGSRIGSGDAAAGARKVSGKTFELKQRMAAGNVVLVDYHALLGLRKGCTRSELECTYLLLCLRHRPDRATGYIDRCEFAEDRDLDNAREQARMSCLLLYRLLQKAYAHVMATIAEEEAAHKQRQRIAATTRPPPAAAPPISTRVGQSRKDRVNPKVVHCKPRTNNKKKVPTAVAEKTVPEAVLPARFCRETAASGGLLSPGYGVPVHHLPQAMSC